ncbi:MAG: hypothetical protein ACNYPG_06215 [Candidatus Porifericomitaceae bacterium WSBS_2022_MAG_OTU9]
MQAPQQNHTTASAAQPTEPPRRSMKLAWRLFMAACAATLLLDFTQLRYGERIVESWWGFYGIFAFCACVGVAMAALLLRRLLLRPQDYYERGQDD